MGAEGVGSADPVNYGRNTLADALNSEPSYRRHRNGRVVKNLRDRLATGMSESGVSEFLAADEMILEAAVNAKAEAIITHNVNDFLPAAGGFHQTSGYAEIPEACAKGGAARG